MPIDEEQPDVALEITNEAKRMLQGKLVSSGVAGVLSLIPGVGAAVTELMTELAIQRTNNRVKEMFDHFTTKIIDIGEQKVDREWFRSEEFQTLLYDALQQLHVTHDREKIEMLGVALANSGAPDFKHEQRKDLFVRFVRDLTVQHIKMLVELAPKPQPWDASSSTPEPLPDETARKLRWNWRPTLRPKDDDLLAIQMLHAYGLVEENLKSSIEEPRIPSKASVSEIKAAVRTFSKNIANPSVTRTFRLSPLGDEFLKFMGLPKPPALSHQ